MKISVRKNNYNPLRRKHFMRSLAIGSGASVLSALESLALEPEWIEVVEVDLPMANLPQVLVGKRVVQISDIHCSRVVKVAYLQRCVSRINGLRPDVVVMTGDYVTYHNLRRYTKKFLKVMGGIRSKNGVYACLGNHDYGLIRGVRAVQPRLVRDLVEGMGELGIRVLRNEGCAVSIDGQRIWVVGLGDLWSGDFDAEGAFLGVPLEEPIIALSHNPDTVESLQGLGVNIVMSGHTHGGQVRVAKMRPPILTMIKNKEYHSGMFEVGDTKLYVNRGLGRLGRIRYNCRPEITVFTLSRS